LDLIRTKVSGFQWSEFSTELLPILFFMIMRMNFFFQLSDLFLDGF